jgi:hypothetical protein
VERPRRVPSRFHPNPGRHNLIAQHRTIGIPQASRKCL